MRYIDVKQLSNIAQEVSKKKKKKKNALEKIFSIKTAFFKKLCFSGLTEKSNSKFKDQP